MDQLKLVLEQRFWVLCAVALLLPPIGWWMGTGSLATETDQRTKLVNAAFTSVEALAKDPTKNANKNWTTGAKQVTQTLTTLVEESQQKLSERQKPSMVWPEPVQLALKEAGVKAHGEGAVNQAALTKAKMLFLNRYSDEWEKVVNLIHPYNAVTGTGKILVDEKEITSAKGKMDEWRVSMLFTPGEMYDAQEDLWLLTALMEAIERVNKGATDLDSAPIKRLIELTLRGGNLADRQTRLMGNTLNQNQFQVTPGGAAPPGVRPKSLQHDVPRKFDADDLFGSDGSAAGPVDRKDKSAAAATPISRFVDGLRGKWDARGFVMKLVMDERQIPTLVSELSYSPFPVEIRHIEYEAYDFQKMDQSNVGSLVNAQIQATPALATTGEQAVGAMGDKQKRIRMINDGMRMALNQNYMASVIIAGVLTIYDEPTHAPAAAPGSPTPALAGQQPVAASSAPPKGPAGTAAATGAPAPTANGAAAKNPVSNTAPAKGPAPGAGPAAKAGASSPANPVKAAGPATPPAAPPAKAGGLPPKK